MSLKNFSPEMINTPWKIFSEIRRVSGLPYIWLYFLLHGVRWGSGWRILGRPIIQRHRKSLIEIGNGVCIRSFPASNPLGPFRPAILSTRSEGAILRIGENVGISGGTICAAERIEIGNRVTIGANSIIVDTDFHPLDPLKRAEDPHNGAKAPVIIEDDVFIGMNSLILKGVNIGRGSVIGAGSVVSGVVPASVIFAGNPACLIRHL